MATIPNEKLILRTPQAPVLPIAPTEYSQQYQDQYNNALRLYFNQMVGVVASGFGVQGGQYIDCPYGLFFNTSEQIFAAPNTAYPIVYDNTYLSHGVALQSGSTSKVEVSVGGIYNFQFSGQLLSTNSSAKTMYIWISRNGTDIGYSTRAKTISTNNEYSDLNWNFNIDLQVGDYIEIKGSTTNVNLHFHSETAASPHPGIPSSVLTVNFIAPLPSTLPTPP
jgi:hypothetical protein